MDVHVTINGVEAVVSVEAKEFKTGSRGFAGWGKIQLPDGVYSVGLTLVLAGSKPKRAAANRR